MKILILGPRDRYDVYMPDFAAQLPVELVSCPSDASPMDTAARHPDTEVIFTDPGFDITAELMDRLPRLKLIQSEGAAYHRIDLDAAREMGLRAWLESAVPGRYCPKSAALAMERYLKRRDLL